MYIRVLDVLGAASMLFAIYVFAEGLDRFLVQLLMI